MLRRFDILIRLKTPAVMVLYFSYLAKCSIMIHEHFDADVINYSREVYRILVPEQRRTWIDYLSLTYLISAEWYTITEGGGEKWSNGGRKRYLYIYVEIKRVAHTNSYLIITYKDHSSSFWIWIYWHRFSKIDVRFIDLSIYKCEIDFINKII